MAIPVLMITWNRLEYTKKALKALVESKEVLPVVIDNGSEDGTAEWLRTLPFGLKRPMILFNDKNYGIAFAMNQFLELTKNHEVVGKVDSDTIVPIDWAIKMRECLKYCHMVQAKHPIIKATHANGWAGFTAGMKKKNGLLYNHFIGGSGILFWRNRVDRIPEMENKIMGWRLFQSRRPELTKAFCESVEIKLLDDHGYSDYPEYYKQTGRI